MTVSTSWLFGIGVREYESEENSERGLNFPDSEHTRIFSGRQPGLDRNIHGGGWPSQPLPL
jgi:hypothetical protein